MLKAYLFGPMRIMQDGEPLALPVSVPARSLLAYLLLDKETPHSRLVLAGNLWPEMEEVRARRRLSQALWRLRDALPGLIESDRQIISVNTTAIWVDADAFQDMTKTDRSLHQAVTLYTGPLLDGFYEDWAIVRREHIRETYLQSLEHLISLEKAAGRFEEALAYGQRLVAMDPLQENIHRELMRLYMALDRPKSALKQFETCRQVLRTELGAEPNPASVQLAEEIARRTLLESPADLPQPEISAPTGYELSSQIIPLIGRDGERRTLLAHIDRMLDGQGGLILVEGEAGVGKTRLLQEIAGDAGWRGIQSLWGYGREMEVTPPFGPLVAALESGLTPLRVEQLSQTVEKPWLQVLTVLLPLLASHLPKLQPPSPVDPNQEQPRLLEAISQFLIAWARITPLIIILENLHWIDRDTLDILPGLVRRIGPAGILVIGTYRGEEARAYPVLWEKLQTIDRAGRRDRLTLARLDAPATGELIHRWLDSRVGAPIFETRLYQETEGNPLFVLETLRALQDEGLLQRSESGQWSTPWDETTGDYAELPLPPAVERVIARRLDRLAPETRAILETAAVLGNQFEFTLLNTLSRRDSATLLDALGNLVRRQFLLETPQAYHFSHDKIRQVAYQSIEESQRPRLHRQAGEALERQHPDRVPSLAFHFYQGQVWDKAVEYQQQAGDQARLIYASAEAIHCYDRAIEYWSHLPSSDANIGLSLYQKRGRICQETGRFDQAEADFRAAYEFAEQVEDKASLSRILNHLSYLQFQRGDFDGAATVARRALDLATIAGLSSEIAAGLLNEANALRNLGHYQQAIEVYEQAAAIFERKDDQTRLADCLNRMGAALAHTGDYTKARSSMESSISIRRRLDDRMGISYSLINLAGFYYKQGQFARTRQAAQEALEIASAIGDPYGEDAAFHFLGLAILELESPVQAIPYFQQTLKIGREIGDQAIETEVLVDLGRAYKDMNDLDKAQDMLEQSLRMAAISIEHYRLTYVYYHLVELYLDLEQYEEAIGYAHTGLQKAQEIGEPWSLGRAYRIMGEVAAHLGSEKAGAEPAYHFDESVRILREIGAEAELAHSLAAYGLYLRGSDQVRRGAAMMDDARTQFQRLGMKTALARLEAEISVCLLPGQLKIHLPRADAPAGRPLREDEWVEIVWTAYAPEDESIAGKTACRRHRLQRLLEEAASQGAAPTLTDLAAALNVSTATIKRDLAALREAGILVHTRGSRRK